MAKTTKAYKLANFDRIDAELHKYQMFAAWQNRGRHWQENVTTAFNDHVKLSAKIMASQGMIALIALSYDDSAPSILWLDELKAQAAAAQDPYMNGALSRLATEAERHGMEYINGPVKVAA